MHNALCEQLGIDVPIFAFSHCRDVVAAVTKAGGMGVLGAVAHSPKGLEIDLAWIDNEVGDLPYGVDLLLPVKFNDDGAKRTEPTDAKDLFPPAHTAFINGMLEQYDVPALPPDLAARGGRMSVSPEAAGTLLDVALTHPIRLFASALGPPPEDFIRKAHEQGAVVAALAGTAAHARRHKDAGVDLIVAQGTEAGGHTGTVSTLVLVPEVVQAVAPTPVLAAGGIVKGSQIAAAMALGAAGVWCGSVWLTTEEAETHPAVKQKMLTASSSDTVRSRSLTGKPARMLRTPWTDAWEAEGAPAPLGMPLQTMLVAEAQQRIGRSAHNEGTGANDLATYFVGQGVGLMDRIRPTRQVVEEMVQEYLQVAEMFAAQVAD
ncbi:MAG: nitronate monooxygenase [Frankiaceae bacterium]|nr:nitronate monooxygenase [Frankiaceae bacterium]MBV9869517.1 nitronate monooxygenase [Frankiaceae bacterium]